MTRAGLIVSSMLAALAVARPGLAPVPKLIWNGSASVPVGLYAVHSGGPYHVEDLVAVTAPEPLASFLEQRGYLARDLPLIKYVLAVAGQTVCRSGLRITVDGVEAGTALGRDRAGRALPAWQGCRRVAAGEVFLMNPRVRDSFDGRYFGLTRTNQIVGRAVPLCTDEDQHGGCEWRAPTR